MDFIKDLREIIIHEMKSEGIKFNENCSIKQLLISFYNAEDRMISDKPRKVHMSDRVKEIIKENKIDGENYKNEEEGSIAAIYKFADKFENGDDLKGHLSTRIFNSKLFKSDGEIRKNMDARDYMLMTLGIHHIHLKVNKASCLNEMKQNRSAYLLFAKVTDDEVYFIDIKRHSFKNFYCSDLLRILERNWNYLFELAPYQDDLVEEITDDKILESRNKNGYMPYVKINGNIYRLPGDGVTSGGTNIRHIEKADEIICNIKVIESNFRNEGKEAKLELTEDNGIKIVELSS